MSEEVEVEDMFARSDIVSDVAGFKPRFKAMEDDQMKILAAALFAEAEGQKPNFPEEEWPPLLQIKLPITFTDYAKIGLLGLVTNPGMAVTLLIDALNMYEDKEVTAEMLCELYPFGFYDDPSFTDYVDNYLKTRKVRWSEIY